MGTEPYLASMLIHVVAGVFVGAVVPRLPRLNAREPVAVAIQSRKRPLPDPPPPPVEPTPRRRARARLPKVEAMAPTPEPTPAPTPAPRATAPPVFGISMESAVTGPSSVAVPIGNTLQIAPTAPRPTAIAEAAPPVASRAAAVIVPPRIVHEARASYPREAREAGIEGKVILVLTVGPDGRVRRARVVRGLGKGLDEAALAAARQFVFRAGTADGKPQEMEIRFTVTFVLDD